MRAMQGVNFGGCFDLAVTPATQTDAQHIKIEDGKGKPRRTSSFVVYAAEAGVVSDGVGFRLCRRTRLPSASTPTATPRIPAGSGTGVKFT